nr:ribonuclease H-like domain-containing protein [Tanacetum cinerariifolium]
MLADELDVENTCLKKETKMPAQAEEGSREPRQDHGGLNSREDTNQPSPPPIAPSKAPQMVSSVKLPIIKKGEYILWTMKMEQYLAHIDYALWEVILNGNGEVQMTKDKASNEVEVPLITAQQILARTRARKAKSTLLVAIPDEHLARFYGIKDAKTLWA